MSVFNIPDDRFKRPVLDVVFLQPASGAQKKKAVHFCQKTVFVPIGAPARQTVLEPGNGQRKGREPPVYLFHLDFMLKITANQLPYFADETFRIGPQILLKKYMHVFTAK